MSGQFTELYDQHVDAVYGYLAYRLGSRTEAESLTRLTFERAAREWNEASAGPPSDRVWLLSIARRLTRARHIPAVPGADDLGISPGLARALARLDRGPRSVIALRFGADLRGGDIAGILDLSPDQVRHLLSQGIRRLRSELEREPGRESAERDPGRRDQQQEGP
jgi:DNA-directed RNA polymerase specialized sigma24 family protein